MARIILSLFIIKTCLVSCSNFAQNINNIKPIITPQIVGEYQDQSLNLFLITLNNKILLDTVDVPNDTPNLVYAFSHKIMGKPYIFTGISYYEDYKDFEHPYVNYSNFYLTNIYKCDLNFNCVYDKELSHFFGIGGDLVDSNSNKVLNSYPYKNESDIKRTFQKNYFNDWLNNNLVEGQITEKTQVSDVPNYYVGATDFLLPGTYFNIIDVSSGWLNISTNQIEGWVKCKDTNIC